MPFATITRCNEGRNNEFLARMFKPQCPFGHSFVSNYKGLPGACILLEKYEKKKKIIKGTEIGVSLKKMVQI